MAQPNVSEGMAGMYKEMAKLDGVPVLQIMSMGGAGQPGQTGDAAAAPAPQQQAPPQERPSIGGALGGALGGRLGLGGLGREESRAPGRTQARGAGSRGRQRRRFEPGGRRAFPAGHEDRVERLLL